MNENERFVDVYNLVLHSQSIKEYVYIRAHYTFRGRFALKLLSRMTVRYIIHIIIKKKKNAKHLYTSEK